MSRNLLSGFLLLLAPGVPAWAQTPDTATIHGRAVDQSRAPLAGVSIIAANTQTGLRRDTVSDASGDFSLAGLPVAGQYDIRASKAGFAEARLRDVTLEGGINADVNLQLNVAGGQTQVTVTGLAGDIRTDAPQLGVP